MCHNHLLFLQMMSCSFIAYIVWQILYLVNKIAMTEAWTILIVHGMYYLYIFFPIYERVTRESCYSCMHSALITKQLLVESCFFFSIPRSVTLKLPGDGGTMGTIDSHRGRWSFSNMFSSETAMHGHLIPSSWFLSLLYEFAGLGFLVHKVLDFLISWTGFWIVLFSSPISL